MIEYKKVSIGHMCNNDCLYCQFANEVRENRYLSEIEADLKRRDGFDSVEILGGEPTIRSDFIDTLNCARMQGYVRIKLVTNARAFSDWELARAAVEYGAHLFEVKMCGFSPGMHEDITRTSGSFSETIQGISNLRCLQIPGEEALDPFVAIRIPICTENCEYIENIVRFLIPLRIDRIILSFDDYNLAMDGILAHLFNTIETATFSRIWIQTEKIPLCLMTGYEHHVSETFLEKTGFPLKQHKNCAKCVYSSSCKGIVAEYLEKHGSKEFRPVVKSKHAQDLEGLRSQTKQGA